MADAPDTNVTLVVDSDGLVDPPRPGSFLRLRSIGLRIETDAGLSERGVWEFIERPRGLDAVVVIVWRRAERGIEVLLRRGLRVPTALGRPGARGGAGHHTARLISEVVAGLVEKGEHDAAGLVRRAQAEVEEEAGLTLSLDRFTTLGGPLWGSPGLSAEVLFWFAADATDAPPARPAKGDGSPFELVGDVVWRTLDDALEACAAGDVAVAGSLGDLRTELGFHRLKAMLR